MDSYLVAKSAWAYRMPAVAVAAEVAGPILSSNVHANVCSSNAPIR